MLIDLHTHTIFSDGELIPSELARRAVIHGYEAIAITDHADYTNLEQLIEAAKKAKYIENEWDIHVLAGVELTHFSFTSCGAASWVMNDKGHGRMATAIHGRDYVD